MGVCTHTIACTHVNTFAQLCVCTHARPHARSHMRVCAPTCTCMCMSKFMSHKNTHKRACVCTRAHTYTHLRTRGLAARPFLIKQGAAQLSAVGEGAGLLPPCWADGGGPCASHGLPPSSSQLRHAQPRGGGDTAAAAAAAAAAAGAGAAPGQAGAAGVAWEAPLLLPVCAWPGLPVDLVRLLQAADARAMLPAVLPCVVEVLAFVHLDPHVLRAGECV